MSKLNEHDWKIINSFQRYLKSKDISCILEYTLDELVIVDERLGARDINASYRLAIKNRIIKLKQLESDESKRNMFRNGSIISIAGIIISIIVSIVLWYFG